MLAEVGSSTMPFRQIMRSFRRRENMSSVFCFGLEGLGGWDGSFGWGIMMGGRMVELFMIVHRDVHVCQPPPWLVSFEIEVERR